MKTAPPVEPGPRVLAIGGSDPSGAAGIQADVKTLTALGVFGAAAVTAVTVQNQRGVTDVMPMSASLVMAQVDAAISDAPCDAIKTGMLASIDIVHALADPLLPEDAKDALVERLIPAAALITPNIPEATALTGVPISCAEDMGIAADHLLARGAAAVLIKGGHLVELDPEIEEITDLLRTVDGEEARFVRTRRKVGPKGGEYRGTGCTLASAVAAGIAEGLTLKGAVERARDYLDAAMAAAGPYLNVRGLAHSAGMFTISK
jgi:hydroxymethylpyrimidine/phosphomethylpyrimidine kinase